MRLDLRILGKSPSLHGIVCCKTTYYPSHLIHTNYAQCEVAWIFKKLEDGKQCSMIFGLNWRGVSLYLVLPWVLGGQKTIMSQSTK